MNNKYTTKGGFTLPELLVAMSVIVLVIFASTNLVISIIRSNTNNINTMIAYGLAQEGIEGIRNIRDSNWLLGAGFDGRLKGTEIWGDTFGKSEDLKFFIIDLGSLATATGEVNSPSSLSNNTPWEIEGIEENEFESHKTKIKKFMINEQSGEFRYGHSLGEQPGEETPFYRYLEIYKVQTPYDDNGTEVNKYRVACIVEWMEFGRSRSVRLDTELTDWYQGQ